MKHAISVQSIFGHLDYGIVIITAVPYLDEKVHLSSKGTCPSACCLLKVEIGFELSLRSIFVEFLAFFSPCSSPYICFTVYLLNFLDFCMFISFVFPDCSLFLCCCPLFYCLQFLLTFVFPCLVNFPAPCAVLIDFGTVCFQYEMDLFFHFFFNVSTTPLHAPMVSFIFRVLAFFFVFSLWLTRTKKRKNTNNLTKVKKFFTYCWSRKSCTRC